MSNLLMGTAFDFASGSLRHAASGAAVGVGTRNGRETGVGSSLQASKADTRLPTIPTRRSLGETAEGFCQGRTTAAEFWLRRGTAPPKKGDIEGATAVIVARVGDVAPTPTPPARPTLGEEVCRRIGEASAKFARDPIGETPKFARDPIGESPEFARDPIGERAEPHATFTGRSCTGDCRSCMVDGLAADWLQGVGGDEALATKGLRGGDCGCRCVPLRA
jgi:hypothetical protein